MEIIEPSFKEIMKRIPFQRLKGIDAEIVVGVERGGLPVAAIVASGLGIPMVSVKASLYDDRKPARKIHPAPVIGLRGVGVKGKRVLVADDVSNTGATLAAVKDALLKKGAKEVKTFALYGRSDFSEERFGECVKFPWEIRE
ncbi:hypothetical protein COT30_01195 [Candidatus Micrarchaeota archaeon CG08_land_8_20_14_0_20_49_17]|nr:MAG: hypothetical protein AUJ13_06050 [Candidatus Micrarchaeota archaeon CG1_02_49_24]PIU10061.1 MAG: hypothetical protein COT30_01195 [Candidatus Micrarchaeota archaeon CG08_land_8_20_14_0_20_49_17]PIU82649.1 MAG: hypothetical protein COS70_00185 [Candidatus Micrarchaeota archaeon CG06_land_8_20_14_3_00_50_6]HII54011.1 phosphoribosyltransferase [Candidatus Micrarchaeota archaeon]